MLGALDSSLHYPEAQGKILPSALPVAAARSRIFPKARAPPTGQGELSPSAWPLAAARGLKQAQAGWIHLYLRLLPTAQPLL